MTSNKRSPKPEPIAPDFESLETTVLVSYPQWVVWKYEWQDERGEWAKVPWDAERSYRASSTNSDTWCNYEMAKKTYENSDYDGVGFVFSPDSPLVGIDYDDARDGESERPIGGTDSHVMNVIRTVDSFTYVSTSATGYHTIAEGFVPEGGNRADLPGEADHLEMYDSGRYFAITGVRDDICEDTPADIESRASEIYEVHREYISGDDDESVPSADETALSEPVDLNDEELLKKAKNAKNGDEFRQLWNGDTSMHSNDHSRADLALCSYLAFWTGGDQQRIDRFFRQSDLMRSKWDETHSSDGSTYGEMTIAEALDSRTNFYDPQSSASKATADGGTATELITPDLGRDDVGEVRSKFIDACQHYNIDPTAVGSEPRSGEKVVIGVSDIVPEKDVGAAVMEFKRNADRLDGTDTQAVISRVIFLDLKDSGEFFRTTDSRLFYFHDDELEIYRVDGDGNRTLNEEFQAMVWDRYNLFAGRFSRNLGDDLKRAALRTAPEKEISQFAHYNEKEGELYVTDWETGYYAIMPEGIEWRANGTDAYFLPDRYAESYDYVEPNERPTLPDEVPGERPMWLGSGDPLMRMFGNRTNFSEKAALTPHQQRQQLYLHLHTLPFIDLLNARPIMAWVGEKGSGKTVVERSIGRFIYGPDYTESAMPDAKDDFVAKVTNQALAFVDNYDDGEDWANDILAAVATGTGVNLRELYTTNDLYREVPRCWLSITSRDPPFRRDDVADRTLVFRVERVDDGFVGMGDYLRQVNTYRDLLWSTYLDNLQAVLKEYHTRDTGAMSSQHRMADWAIFSQIVADALEVGTIDELLETMETERATFALENESWAAVIGEWIRDDPEDAATWRKASSLIDQLQDIADANDRPFTLSNAAGLGSKLSTYRTELAELYHLEVDETGRANRYRFAVDDGTMPTGLDRF